MHPSSFWVLLDLNEFGHFYYGGTGQPLNELRLVTKDSEFVPSETRLFSSEIQIYQTIHLIVN
jgi:hypothetical protein